MGAEDLVAGVVLADGGQEAPDSAALTGGLDLEALTGGLDLEALTEVRDSEALTGDLDLEARRPEGIIGLITVMGRVVWVVVPSC